VPSEGARQAASDEATTSAANRGVRGVVQDMALSERSMAMCVSPRRVDANAGRRHNRSGRSGVSALRERVEVQEHEAPLVERRHTLAAEVQVLTPSFEEACAVGLGEAFVRRFIGGDEAIG